MDEKAILAVNLLREKFSELDALPKKSDFEPETVCLIKQKLGPWPRALEAAGLKAAPTVSAKEKNRRKRERLRKKRKHQSGSSETGVSTRLPDEKKEEEK